MKLSTFYCALVVSLLVAFTCAFYASAETIVYENEYVVRAKGQWQVYSPCYGTSYSNLTEENKNKFCPGGPTQQATTVHSPGTYLVTKDGRVLDSEQENTHRSLSVIDEMSTLADCPVVQSDSVSCGPNIFYKTEGPLRAQQWYLDAVNVAKMWRHGQGAGKVVVAVVDTGVAPNHPDLNVLPGKSFVSGTTWHDDNGHGTHVAGLCCATTGNDVGIQSPSLGIPVLPVKFLAANGSGSTLGAVKSIDWVTAWAQQNPEQRVILNASFGSAGYSKPLEDALEESGEQGILAAIAAGNSNLNLDHKSYWPAKFSGSSAITVGANKENGKRAYFSNYGKPVHVFAPGTNMLSTWHDNGYRSISGTSMATPLVAGIAAYLWSHEPDKSSSDIRDRLVVNKNMVAADSSGWTLPEPCRWDEFVSIRSSCRGEPRPRKCRRLLREQTNCKCR